MRYLELSIAMFQRATNKKALGDICGFRVRDFQWGARELSEFIIVPFETNLLPSQLKKKLDFISDRVGANGVAFRYCVDLTDLKKYYKPLGTKKSKDVEWRYQPFLQNSRFDYFIPENKNRVIDKRFIDCGEDAEQYVVVPYGAKIIYDKDTDTMISLDEMPNVVMKEDY